MESDRTIYIMFSEKQIAAGIRRGKVVVLNTEKELEESIMNTLNTLQIKLEVIKANGFEDTLVGIAKLIKQNLGKEFIIDLTDAELQKALAVISAFFLLDVNAVMLIGDKQFTTTDISPAKIPLTNDHIEVIKAIDEGYTSVSSISKRTGIPLTSTWRRIKELRKDGIVDEANNLTQKGKLLLKIYHD